ncbi:hypothetical protein Dsin_001351 [Dipteronia sinensis]|uniref:HAT C-terminal dimerisation domain-containing protein n=1 Tax=Dipteronia sinensis TaxID=43782 RepID=A0AAE0B533_9ROSI|nr:hypothetical protein Dsin_001351 [Dipteronia sinensis]
MARPAQPQNAELNNFLNVEFSLLETAGGRQDIQKFDLPLWWKNHSNRYPVLSQLARDVLIIPMSTVSSEQAFSTSGRIIDPRRTTLTPEMVEVLTCFRNWEHVRMRMQYQMDDEEVIQNFANLYVDEGSGSKHVEA